MEKAPLCFFVFFFSPGLASAPQVLGTHHFEGTVERAGRSHCVSVWTIRWVWSPVSFLSPFTLWFVEFQWASVARKLHWNFWSSVYYFMHIRLAIASNIKADIDTVTPSLISQLIFLLTPDIQPEWKILALWLWAHKKKLSLIRKRGFCKHDNHAFTTTPMVM